MTQRSAAVSSGQEPIDLRQGRLPLISRTDTSITFELGILGGEMRSGATFTPTPRTRLVVHCDRSGEITARIAEGRSSAV